MKVRIKPITHLIWIAMGFLLLPAFGQEPASRSKEIVARELDELAERLIRAEGARSAFFGYRGYPGHICVSINEQVVHGIPGSRRVRVGDVVSIDVGVIFEGFVGDTARTTITALGENPTPEQLQAAFAAQWWNPQVR